MEPEKAKARIEALRELIEKYRYAYHVLDKSLVSDAVNDSLKHELEELEKRFPQFASSDSPTQRIGGEALEEFQKVSHNTAMLSLTDAFSLEEIEDWLERLKKLTKANLDEFYGELKIDGLALSLVYQGGLLVRGATRGDGLTGEDVTQNIKTIEAIPLKLEFRPDPALQTYEHQIKEALKGTIEIRGEAFMRRSVFRRLNLEQEQRGGRGYANPRNIAAGSIRQLDPKITASRKLDFYAYGIISSVDLATHLEEHLLCRALGVKVNSHSEVLKGLKGIKSYHKRWEQKKNTLDYWFDGVVVTVNNNRVFNELGVVGKAPRGAIAFKFSAEEATTRLKEVVWQVGRTGKLTPVAVLEPVRVSGVVISRATLHNLDEIIRKDILIGDTVIIRRAGEVIPEVVGAVKDLRSGEEKAISALQKCPVCDSPITKKENEVDLFCLNKNCYASNLLHLRHFCSKGAFDFEGLGEKVLRAFYDNGLIKTPLDLFELKKEDIASLERFGERSAENVINEIKSKSQITLDRFIYALGIRHVGLQTAQDLADYFCSLNNFCHASEEQLSQIENIGPIIAHSIAQYLNDKKNQDFIRKLTEKVKVLSVKNKTGHLKDKVFLFTGTLSTLTRQGAFEKVKALGGKISETVNESVDYLVVGNQPGSKLAKARQHPTIKVISESEFVKLIGQEPIN